jgi:monothiol glutaredoxin
MEQIFSRIKNDIENNDVVVFLKGTASSPKCGFSSVVATILTRLGVTFKDVDVLADPEIREGIKQFSDWPTIPQLYIKGEFIGGCDITKELYESGELEKILKEKKILVNS